MKVVCDGCSTKYSIDDDKLAGKTFRIKCRKCGKSILLHGDIGAAPALATVWHAVRDGQQIGPFDSGELMRRRAAGEIDDQSYVWREGFAEWQPLGSIEELRVAPEAAPLPLPPAGPATAPAEPANGSRLFAERRESSLLFTLDGLAKMANPAPRQAPAQSPGRSGPTEGSGLIDIRSLARAYAPVARPAEAARPALAPSIGSLSDPLGSGLPGSDLPVFPTGSFIAPSVLVPTVRRRDRRVVVGLAAAVGMLAICATLLLVVMFIRGGQPEAVAAPNPAPGPRVASIDPPRPASPAVVEAPAAPAPAVPAAPAPAPAPAAQAHPPAPAPAPAPAPQARPPAPPGPQVRPPAPAPQVRPPAPAPATPAKCDQVTCIVNGYDSECCRALQAGGPLAPTGPAPAHSTLPESLDRAAITEGLATISTKRCSGASSATGLVKAHVKVSAAGAVTSVNVESAPDAALSACVVEQVQRGHFQPTQRGGSFSYVWRF